MATAIQTPAVRRYALGLRLKNSQPEKFVCAGVSAGKEIKSADVPPWFALLDCVTPYHERNLPNPDYPAPACKCAHGVYMSARDMAASRASFCFGCNRGVPLASARGETLTKRCAEIAKHEKSSQIYSELQDAIVACTEDDMIISGADAVSDEIAAREDALGDEHPLRARNSRTDSEDAEFEVSEYRCLPSAPGERTSVGRDVSPTEWRQIKERIEAKESQVYAAKSIRWTKFAEHVLSAKTESTNPQTTERWFNHRVDCSQTEFENRASG
jgi:hypothetical protein